MRNCPINPFDTNCEWGIDPITAYCIVEEMDALSTPLFSNDILSLSNSQQLSPLYAPPPQPRKLNLNSDYAQSTRRTHFTECLLECSFSWPTVRNSDHEDINLYTQRRESSPQAQDGQLMARRSRYLERRSPPYTLHKCFAHPNVGHLPAWVPCYATCSSAG